MCSSITTLWPIAASGSEMVRDEQETAAAESRPLRRKMYPPDHVESANDIAGAAAPSSARRTPNPVGVLAMVIVTCWPRTAPGATSAVGVRPTTDRDVAPHSASAASVATCPVGRTN